MKRNKFIEWLGVYFACDVASAIVEDRRVRDTKTDKSNNKHSYGDKVHEAIVKAINNKATSGDLYFWNVSYSRWEEVNLTANHILQSPISYKIVLGDIEIRSYCHSEGIKLTDTNGVTL